MDDNGVAVAVVFREVEAGVHEGIAVVFASGGLVDVDGVRVESAELHEVDRMNGRADHDEGEESFAPVFRYIHPRCALAGLAVVAVGRQDQTVEVAAVDDVVVAVVIGGLLADEIFFFVGQLGLWSSTSRLQL